MKTFRLLAGFFAASLLAISAFASDPAGAWRWKITTPNGEVETTLTLTSKDGKLAGTYSNSYGETPISNATFKDDMLTFTVDREIGGNKFTLKFQGKVEGDTVKGTIEVPGMNGGDARKMDWNGQRVVMAPVK
jgi:hypothetical protein